MSSHHMFFVRVIFHSLQFNRRDLRNQGHLQVYRIGEIQNEERERLELAETIPHRKMSSFSYSKVIQWSQRQPRQKNDVHMISPYPYNI